MISRDSLKGITSVIAVGLAIFQIYFTAGFGIIDSQLLRTIHLGIVLALVFLYFPPKKLQEGEREHPGWLALDLVLICGAFATAYFLASDIDYYMERIRYVDPVSDAETVCATAAVLLVLEATRRVAGLPLVIVASAFLAYGLGGQYLPGILRHDGVTYKMLCEQLYLVTEGLYGIPLAVSSTMIFAFVMFGCFLQRAGLGQVFLDLACVLTRRSKGGPAKVSIFASALFGSISGSAVANVYSTGTFTIPLMKRVGYRPEFAGAVEAVASSGGLIMPPVMGSIAFVMAEYTGISYLSICKAALLPAVLYYLSLFTMIHFEALRHGLGGTPSDLIPELRSIKRKLYYLAPLALLIVLMIAGRSIIFSALLACAAVVALSFLSPETRLTPARFLATMENAAANLLMIAACCACVGIVIGVVTMTGFGFSFVNLMGSLAQVHIGIFLLVLAGTCVIFGMGLPSLPAYILVATFGAPALVQAGVPVLAAHLFVMYFAISSGITPPVCLVAYAGAAIADAPPMKTGFTAFKLGIAAFIVPFIFIFEPALLLMGDWATILQAVFTAVLGVVCLASSMQGWLFTESSPAERVMMFVAGIVLVYPGLLTDLIGFGTASLVFFIQIARKKRLCAA